MKKGIIVLCRYSSSRLPGKILKPIQGKPILQYILERLQKVTQANQIVVATSDHATDDAIAEFCQQQSVNCYRGSLQNVALRFLNCAEAYGFDYAVRINGDNLFVDPGIIDTMLEQTKDRSHDFITNVPGRTFPIGMSVEVMKVSFYQQLIKRFEEEKYREHVTLYLYDYPEAAKISYYYNESLPEAKGVKIAVDDMDDFILAERVIKAMPSSHTQYGMQEIVNLIKGLKE